MAIVSLHNVNVPESSVLRESQPLSSSLSLDDNITRMTGTRASSILQMWREHEYVVNNSRERVRSLNVTDVVESDNGSVNETESRIESMDDNEESQSRVSDQSHDFGEVERERVRQVFREWKNSGVAVTPRTSNCRSSRGQWLGENERERVRIVREWIQMTSQQRDACVGNVDENGGDIGSRIERVRDGEVVGGNDGRGQNRRREIRRLCGRQALLDLLGKKEQERRAELQSLEASRPVTSFAQRNRIQSLLRIRCFQYARSVESSRSTSAAESELGLLRQRQTVSGLREGFLSRLDNNAHVQATYPTDGPSDNNDDGLREHPVQTSSAIEVLACPNDCNGDDHDSSSDDLLELSESIAGDSDSQESMTQVQERMDHPLHTQIQQTSTFENQSLNPVEPSMNESGDFGDLEQSNEILIQQYDDDRVEINDSDQSDNLEGDVLEAVNSQDSSSQAEEWHQQDEDFEGTQWEGTVVSSQWRDDDHVETDRQLWTGDAEESSHGVPENEASVQNDDDEDYWHENDSHETPRDWLDMPYNHEATPSGRLDMYYLSDNDNLHNLELRELLNRRRVSSLLHSGFRESLDQLIRSYVERQTRAAEDSEVHEMPPPPFVSRDHLDDSEGSRRAAPPPPPPLPPAPLPPRQQVLHHVSWFSHEHQNPVTEWETINDLRIDLERLQQRLNNMQRMLEACMNMQIELQRSVRQEVSAALNRSFNPSGSELVANILPKDSFKWECVKKGTCYLCSNRKIDALLYRCGHMCTCTKCANTLLQGNGKCPLCQAPVIEVIHAYFIQ